MVKRQLVANKRVAEERGGLAELIEMLTAAADSTDNPVPGATETGRPV